MTDKELAVVRAKCDKSLLFFTRFFFKELRGVKFGVNWHHEKICEEFEKASRYETRFLNINIPPRHSKTELALNFIARGIGINPRSNWFYVTGSSALRAETSVRIRDIVNHPYFKRMYGVSLRKDMTARGLWRTEQGGGLKTATILSNEITGFAAGVMDFDKEAEKIREFGGAFIMDDLNKMDDAEKGNANNDSVNRRLINTVPSRTNSEYTPFVNIQQRAGEDDATATMLNVFGGMFEKDKISNLVLPVIIDDKPLWKEKMSMELIMAQKKSPETAAMFSTQYMQDPQSPNERPFHKSKLKYFESDELDNILENSEGCVSFVDPKDEGKDYYCHPFGVLVSGAIYIVGVVHNQGNTNVTIPKSVQLMQKFNCVHTIVESNAMGSMVLKKVREGSSHRVDGFHSQAHKDTRIANGEFFIIEHMRFLSDSTDSEYISYMDKLSKFEYGKSGGIDDAPDATAGLASLVMMKYKSVFK